MRISDWSSDVCSSDLLGAGTLDGIANSGCLVCRQVVLHDDVPGLKGWDQHLLDVSQEDVAVHCTVVDERCRHSREAQCSGEGRRFPMPVRYPSSATLASKGTSPQARHLCREAGFVDKDQLLRIEIELAKIGRASCRERVCQSV